MLQLSFHKFVSTTNNSRFPPPDSFVSSAALLLPKVSGLLEEQTSSFLVIWESFHKVAMNIFIDNHHDASARTQTQHFGNQAFVQSSEPTRRHHISIYSLK